MKTYAEIFKALADETRLTMLALLLWHGELCVCDVERVLEISQSKASRHLRYLKNAGLIDDRRDGLWIHYRVADSPFLSIGPSSRLPCMGHLGLLSVLDFFFIVALAEMELTLLVLWRIHRLFEGFDKPHLNDGLGRDLDALACSWIASCSGLAFLFDELAHSGNCEFPDALGLLGGEITELVEDGLCLGLVHLELFCEMLDDLRFGHGFFLGHDNSLTIITMTQKQNAASNGFSAGNNDTPYSHL